jgi:putative peptidoglycan lipid II flippase
MDAFIIAFRIPNLLRRLFAEGAFAQAFVPILAEYKHRRGDVDTRFSSITCRDCSLSRYL